MRNQVIDTVHHEDPPKEPGDEEEAPEVIGPPDNPDAPEVEF
jgi:hypothetical protein